MNLPKEGNFRVFVVRAEFGKWAQACYQGGFVGFGWLDKTELSDALSRGKDYIRELYDYYDPSASVMRKVVNVGEIWRFVEELTPGTLVLTPSENREKLLVGRISGEYYYGTDTSGCPYTHRKPVDWQPEPLLRSALSVPLQNTLGSSLTVFNVSQAEEVLTKLSLPVPTKSVNPVTTAEDLAERVIERFLELTPDDFEILITQLLAAIGFEARHTGRVGDGGIDVEGILDVNGFAKVDLMVQVKRYSSTTINHHDIKKFLGSVPQRSQPPF